MKTERPIMYIVIAIVTAVGGIFGLILTGFVTLFIGVDGFPLELMVLNMAVLVSSVLSVTAAYGLWTHQSWGMKFTYWIYLLNIPLTIVSEWTTPANEKTGAAMIYTVCSLAFSFLVLWYFSPNRRAGLRVIQ